MTSRLATAVAATLALGACRSLVATAEAPQPAVLVAPDAAARAELAAVVRAELGAASAVTLADDALTNNHELLIERAPLHDPAGNPANGRERGRPEHLLLWLVDGHCVLEHDATRVTLAHAHCEPAPR
jgi:hypothetical protein